MQNAKDTFYEVLRDGVAAADAGLTVVLRGVVRPAVIVDENESAGVAELRDCFRLRWTTLRIDVEGPAPLVWMQCEIRYATAGSSAEGSLDRGRAMAAMDAALSAVLGSAPQAATKKNFAALSNGGMVSPMSSKIWWSDVLFGALVEDGTELRRSATVEVWSCQEAGEA